MRLNYKRLKYLRKEREIKQLERARSTGLEQSLLSKYENGKVPNPSAAIVKTMANYLNCEMTDLLLAETDYEQEEFTEKEYKQTIPNRIDIHVYFHWGE